MTGAYETSVEALRSYERKLRTSVEELRAAFTATNGIDLTGLPDGAAGTFADSAAFVAEYRSAAGVLWPGAVAVLGALEDTARTLGETLDRYLEQEQLAEDSIRRIGDMLRWDR
ncbi:MAG TPA: hypothetical protein VJX10_05220 [Pseudonocardiaceae bacterium]|nr:hypothetical protein [Pseudonocardiaceae bacterium]